MIKLNPNKHFTEDLAIEVAPLPKEFVVPLQQHIGRECEVLVKVGDYVKKGQKIGEASGFISAPVHSPVSGRVKSIGPGLHPIFGRATAVVIENDGEEALGYEERDFSLSEVLRQKREDLVDQIKEAGVVGLGGATFPTHVKLKPKNPVDVLVINAAECEPYITCDLRVFLEHTDEVFQGIQVVMYILDVKRAVIGVEDHNEGLIKVLRRYIAEKGLKSIEVVSLPSFYPQGGEKQLIKNTVGREVPLGGLPSDVGVVVQNVGTIYAVYEGLFRGKPLFERVCTVSGGGVNQPKNLLIRVGMSLKWVLDCCGGVKEDVRKVILGGPMMGFAMPSLEIPTIKGTGAILALTDKETFYGDEYLACIRCGRCVEHCPMGLMPADMGLALENGRVDLAKEYGLMDCIECGVCTYVCPAKRPIVQWIKKGKYLARKGS